MMDDGGTDGSMSEAPEDNFEKLFNSNIKVSNAWWYRW